MISNNLSWGDYVTKYEEASDFACQTQEAIFNLNTDLASFNFDAILQGTAELKALPDLLTEYPDLDHQAVSQLLSGLDTALTGVLANYVPILNGDVAVASDMNVTATTQISINSPGGVVAFPDWLLNILNETNFTISGLAAYGLITVGINPYGTEAALSYDLSSY